MCPQVKLVKYVYVIVQKSKTLRNHVLVTFGPYRRHPPLCFKAWNSYVTFNSAQCCVFVQYLIMEAVNMQTGFVVFCGSFALEFYNDTLSSLRKCLNCTHVLCLELILDEILSIEKMSNKS